VLSPVQPKTLVTQKSCPQADVLIDDANSSLDACNDMPALPAVQEANTLLLTIPPTILLPRATGMSAVKGDDAGINLG